MKNKKCTLISCYNLRDIFLKSKLVHQKGAKIDDVFGLSPNHVLSSTNGNKYSYKYEFGNFVNGIEIAET